MSSTKESRMLRRMAAKLDRGDMVCIDVTRTREPANRMLGDGRTMKMPSRFWIASFEFEDLPKERSHQ